MHISFQFIPAALSSTYALVARAVSPDPALEATTETTLKIPSAVISPTTVPEEFLN